MNSYTPRARRIKVLILSSFGALLFAGMALLVVLFRLSDGFLAPSGGPPEHEYNIFGGVLLLCFVATFPGHVLSAIFRLPTDAGPVITNAIVGAVFFGTITYFWQLLMKNDHEK